VLDLEDLTAYKIDYSGVDETPERSDMSLKRLVGASGFEPPASWSRTRRSSQAEPRPECSFATYNSLRCIACDGNRCLAVERERAPLIQFMAWPYASRNTP
jgi:hypothetical protein